jgi:hypothetical protein
VVGSEIVVGDSVAQDEVGGGEHRGGHREGCLLGAAAGLDGSYIFPLWKDTLRKPWALRGLCAGMPAAVPQRVIQSPRSARE